VIYLDTSVALAHLLAEDRHPPDAIWTETVVSSRLLEYELWVRVNARGLASSHGEMVRALLARVALVELSATVLARALDPFPAPVRTLDAIHLAAADFLRKQKQDVQMASYDERMLLAAERMGLAIPAYCRAPPARR
jgi:predicted nucleic acid-binding protein